jgi:hypothetical protein
MPKPTHTKLTTMRLTEPDRARIEAIRVAHGLATLTDAVRFATRAVYDLLPPSQKIPEIRDAPP